jgi:K+-sensing histidine kinase KdpD
LKPGLLATALSAGAGTYFFLAPLFLLNVADVPDIIRLCIFLVEEY